MTKEGFDHFLSLVHSTIEKQDIKFRKAIKAETRLASTFRFLASGESQQSLSYSFRIGRTTVSHIMSETSAVIFQSLKEPYLKCPKSPEDWEAISEKFEEAWNVPHAVGAPITVYFPGFLNVNLPLN